MYVCMYVCMSKTISFQRKPLSSFYCLHLSLTLHFTRKFLSLLSNWNSEKIIPTKKLNAYQQGAHDKENQHLCKAVD